MKSAYNLGKRIWERMPMARFHTVAEFEGVTITAHPQGYRGKTYWEQHLLMGVPYKSEDPLVFDCILEYEQGASTDYREFKITRFRGDNNLGKFVDVHEEDNHEDKLVVPVEEALYHDDQPLTYEIFFPRTGKSARLVRSTPMDSNFMAGLVLGSFIAPLVVGVILALLFGG